MDETGSRGIPVCTTIDLDLTAEDAACLDPEFEVCVQVLDEIAAERPDFRSTIFVRADDHIEALFGRPDHIFVRYADALAALREQGHEIGWHPHCYRQAGGRWVQNTDESSILTELAKILPLARDLGLRIFRMGWGFQTNRIMRFLSDSGFSIDASAIPRPMYAWEQTTRDWRGTPLHPYHPSGHDYRVEGPDTLRILEVPVSVVPIASPDDTEPGVKRYLNLAYRPSVFAAALGSWLPDHDHVVTTSHPSELLPPTAPHGLLASRLKPGGRTSRRSSGP